MLKWNDILAYARNGNPAPDRTVRKTDDEWRRLLWRGGVRGDAQGRDERPFSSEMCSLFKPGIYACAGCDTAPVRRFGQVRVRDGLAIVHPACGGERDRLPRRTRASE